MLRGGDSTSTPSYLHSLHVANRKFFFYFADVRIRHAADMRDYLRLETTADDVTAGDSERAHVKPYIRCEEGRP